MLNCDLFPEKSVLGHWSSKITQMEIAPILFISVVKMMTTEGRGLVEATRRLLMNS